MTDPVVQTAAQPVWLTNLEGELKTAALNFWQWAQNEEQVVVAALTPEAAQLLASFKTFAIGVVTQLMTAEFQNLTGQQKQNITVNGIVQAAKNQGVQMAIQDATTLAQMAYDVVTATQPQGIAAKSVVK